MVNFNIIEGDSNDFYTVAYRFAELYNLNLPINEIKEILNINSHKVCRLRNYCISENLIRPRKKSIKRKKEFKPSYIYRTSTGKCCIVKRSNGKDTYYGTYDDKRVAEKVRDQLIECDWDKSRLKQIQKEVLCDG